VYCAIGRDRLVDRIAIGFVLIEVAIINGFVDARNALVDDSA